MFKLLQERRSIRKFTGTQLSPEQIGILKEAALRAPSGRTLRPCEFVFVTERELLEKLSKAKPHGVAFLAEAGLGVVVLADQEVTDVWIEDASIACITLQYVAESIGLGSCWGQMRNRDHDESTSSETYIQALLGIPAHLRVEAVIGIGQAAEKKEPRSIDELPFEKIHNQRYAK